MSSLAGTRLGAYEVTSLLGEGGMGAVYRGRDTRLDRDVAIKVLLDSFAHDGRFVAYVSDESGTTEVYVRGFPPSTGGKWAVSRGGGYQPRWGSDGKELLYISGRAQLMSVDARAPTTGSASGTSRVLFPAPIYGGGATINNWYWDVAAGGERMLFNAGSTDTGASLVTVVVNWQAGSPRRADE